VGRRGIYSTLNLQSPILVALLGMVMPVRPVVWKADVPIVSSALSASKDTDRREEHR
jgi:hypothetical protein